MRRLARVHLGSVSPIFSRRALHVFHMHGHTCHPFCAARTQPPPPHPPRTKPPQTPTPRAPGLRPSTTPVGAHFERGTGDLNGFVSHHLHVARVHATSWSRARHPNKSTCLTDRARSRDVWVTQTCSRKTVVRFHQIELHVSSPQPEGLAEPVVAMACAEPRRQRRDLGDGDLGKPLDVTLGLRLRPRQGRLARAGLSVAIAQGRRVRLLGRMHRVHARVRRYARLPPASTCVQCTGTDMSTPNCHMLKLPVVLY